MTTWLQFSICRACLALSACSQGRVVPISKMLLLKQFCQFLIQNMSYQSANLLNSACKALKLYENTNILICSALSSSSVGGMEGRAPGPHSGRWTFTGRQEGETTTARASSYSRDKTTDTTGEEMLNIILCRTNDITKKQQTRNTQPMLF